MDLTTADLAEMEQRLCHFACTPQQVQADATRLFAHLRRLEAERDRLRAAAVEVLDHLTGGPLSFDQCHDAVAKLRNALKGD